MALQGRGLLLKASTPPGAGTVAARTGGEQAAFCPRPHESSGPSPAPLPPPHHGRVKQSGLLEHLTPLPISLASALPE